MGLVYPIQCERKWKHSFLSVRLIGVGFPVCTRNLYQNVCNAIKQIEASHQKGKTKIKIKDKKIKEFIVTHKEIITIQL